MIGIIDTHHKINGVVPLCRVLQIAPSTFDTNAAIAFDRDLASTSRASKTAPKSGTPLTVAASIPGDTKMRHEPCLNNHEIARSRWGRMLKVVRVHSVAHDQKPITASLDTG
jgi:putative transposase